ncbi:Non-repetitive/WGA-negative nucleoporin C-terminal-domain-containing protein [Aspergillus crustosus]
MFAPKAPVSAVSVRNPRRRQRTSSGESIKPPSSKRQRSNLRQVDKCETGDLADRVPDYRSSIIPIGNIQDTSPAGDAETQRNISIRASKKPEKRKFNAIDPTILSKTDFYVVSQLPSLPDQIRSLQPEPCRCFFASNHGYALVITQSEAIIWPYSAPVSSPSPADVFRLPIPESYKEGGDKAPLGVILSTATSATPGLLILMPRNGNIIYWETVSCAASLGLPRQKQSGLQGFVPGMLSGEHATDIVNSEPSGVMVTFSSGRVAHITVRDSQGKPAVTVSFLRNPSSYPTSGFLGGLKNALGSGFWRKNIAAVRAGISCQRGQRDVVIVTSAGLFEIWDTHWNNGTLLKRQFDTEELLRRALAVHIPNGIADCEVRVWDLAYLASKLETVDSQDTAGQSWQVSVLVGLHSGSNTRGVFVVQLSLSGNAHILSVHPISFQPFPTGSGDPRPRLFIPRPCETAFIVIGRSIKILSLAGVESTPSSQLLIDNGQAQAFFDSINLRSGKTYEVLGSGCEHQAEGNAIAACLLMIRDFGVVRITTLSRQITANSPEIVQVTAQHKLEQAVFYGTMLGNPLDLSSKGDLDFHIEEIEEATLRICQGLLQSTSEFIPTAAISIDQNLKLRAKALDDLSRLLLEHNKILDRRIWWELLWGAEKLAAQRAIWKLEEKARASNTSDPTFLTHVLGLMSEKFKTKPVRPDDLSDPVRSWFLYDTYRMEHLVPWIFHATKPQKGDVPKQMRRLSGHILEASELSLAVLETAFKYRDEHASQFGIGDGYLEEGVLITGYGGLPEFWTSQSISYSETGHLLDCELEGCRAWIQATTSSEASDQQIARKIAQNSARHIRILSRMQSERTRWLSAQKDQKLLDEAIAIKQAHIKQRRWQLFKLAGIGHLADAINLAEEFRDMTALVELVIELQDQNKDGMLVEEAEDVPTGIQYAFSELDRRITQYFEKFGEAWADAFLSRQISMGQSGILFSMKKFQPFITRFLHKHQSYSKLSWINDVIGEYDYSRAAKTLESLAVEREQDIWNHRVELSLAKLANLAIWERHAPSDPRPLQTDIKRLEGFAEMGAVQEVIHGYISPVLQGAIDQKAALELAVEHFANSTTQDRPSLHDLLREALARVVLRQVMSLDQLVDLLTLMDSGRDSGTGQNEFSGNEFHLALRVIRLGDYVNRYDLNYRLALQKLVWRRCMMRDDWDAIGKAIEHMGSESDALVLTTSLFRTLDMCFRDEHGNDPDNPPLYVPAGPRDVLLNEADCTLLSSRFRPEQRAPFSRDLEQEDKILADYIEKGGLEFRFKNFISSTVKVISRPGHDEAVSRSLNSSNTGDDCSHQTNSPTRKERLSWL